MAKKEIIVSREWIVNFIHTQPRDRVEKMVGRALVGLFKRQTDDEKKTNSTQEYNDIGFAGNDAYSGTLTAKYYMKHGYLKYWQLNKWLKPNQKGVPRIAKYHRQLNEIALERQEAVMSKLKGEA